MRESVAQSNSATLQMKHNKTLTKEPRMTSVQIKRKDIKFKLEKCESQTQ